MKSLAVASHKLNTSRIEVALATDQEREKIYRLRHDVYAGELRQHRRNRFDKLSDPLDAFNVYIVARAYGTIIGFVSITPPGHGHYSIDKYFSRALLPFAFDDGLFELRLLTVIAAYRGTISAGVLMYAALRWIEAHGGSRIVAIGRTDILKLYTRFELKPVGFTTRAGAINYELLSTDIGSLRKAISDREAHLQKIERNIDWQLGIPFRRPTTCFHGGAFFEAIGDGFDSLENRISVINADVLDAWYPPSPRVLAALQRDLPWLLQTSPPTGCQGLIRTIASARGIPEDSILVGAGSSALIYLAFRRWLNRGSRVLILDPTYGEYIHVLDNIIGCHIHRLSLTRDTNYSVSLRQLEALAQRGHDLIVIVNPNSPTGRHVPRQVLEQIIRHVPPASRIWLDETYVEYAGVTQTLEQFAVNTPNLVVCKSMSKVYALSGARVAYLCAAPQVVEDLRAITPPWAVSLPGQVAAVNAFKDTQYYVERWRETHQLREHLRAGLIKSTSMEVTPSVANFLLCHLPPNGPNAATVVAECRARHLFIRDVSGMGTTLGTRAVRIAVKDGVTNDRMMRILAAVMGDATDERIAS